MPGQDRRRACGSNALRDVAERRQDAGQSLAAGERQTDTPIARKVTRARQDEIAQAGQSHQRPRIAAQCSRQARGFGDAAGNQCGARIVSEPKPIAQSRRDRQHVLDCAADFDAGNVVAIVASQRSSAKKIREVASEFALGCGRDECRRQSLRDFFCKARARNHPDRRRPTWPNDLVREPYAGR